MSPSLAGTFQPLQHRSGTLRDRLHSYTKSTLGAGGSISEAVRAVFFSYRRQQNRAVGATVNLSPAQCHHDEGSMLTLTLYCIILIYISCLTLQVALPQGESCAAWVAVHAIDFYNDVSTIWAVSKYLE